MHKSKDNTKTISWLTVHLRSSKKVGTSNGNPKVRTKLITPVIVPKAVDSCICSDRGSISILNGSKKKRTENTLKAAKILSNKLERLAENDGKG